MPTTFARAFGALCLLFSLSCLLATAARADLVWNPNTGWRIEGGVLSEITGSDAHNALNLMNRARELEEDGSRGAAIRRYKKVAKRYPASIYASEALYRSGKLYLARRQYFRSFEAFMEVTTRYPNTKHFNDVIGEEYRIASALLDGARNRWWGWFPGFTNRSRAIDYFEIIVQTAPYSDYAPLALMNKARGHLRARETEEAIDALDRMINQYPQSLLAPDAYLKLAQTHALLVEGPNYDQGSTKEAITYYEDFLILFPNDPNVPTAAKGLDEMKQVLAESKIRIGDFYFYKRDNYTAARVFYNEAITSYPDSPVAQRARTKLAEVEAKASVKPGEAPRKKRFFFF
ncbi:outer membrane protein assembly factor BamD [Opitutus terrae]|uniref:Tetratricopeptide TPR_2 repeat protein n=1 Tax=Opitutus terrae (strain DSM 11246 / JCM 15787 / PB90-1) TaxID=452637 RepID=B1ZWC7_OPITP|nr:outer membrane protein assembly factor BamD [Opitutus terrae]ACB76879.1 Tetratricopeptide TPR_2 repeat protein [Opitutus terrae PB90-1]